MLDSGEVVGRQTTDETVRGIDKEGLVGEKQRCKKWKNCDIDEDAEECSSETSSSHLESESALSSDEELDGTSNRREQVCNWGAGPMKLLP